MDTANDSQFIYSIIPYADREHNLQGQVFHDIRNGVLPARRPLIATLKYTLSSTVVSSSARGITILWDILEVCWNCGPKCRPIVTLFREWLAILQYCDAMRDNPRGEELLLDLLAVSHCSH